MAKKKTEDETPKEEAVETKVVEETVTEETHDEPQGETHDEPQGEAGDEAPATQETTDETPKEEEVVETKVAEETDADSTEQEQDIPEDVLKALSVFPEMEFLYVGKGGGIWTKGTPESIRGKAVLYKNPYFKNEKTEK